MDAETRLLVSLVAAAVSGWTGGKALVGWVRLGVDALGRRRQEVRS